jgi:hypothetical protein
VLFAGSGGSDDAWGLADCERTAEGMSCSSVGSTSELRSEFKRVANGSRFWALDGVASSDEETDMGETLTSGGEYSFALSGRSCSDREPPVAAASLCTARAAMSDCAKAERLSCGRRERGLHSKPMQWCSKTCRPWKGPLPPVRSVQVRSLGDLWVEERRPGRGRSRSRLTEWLEEEVRVRGRRRRW